MQGQITITVTKIIFSMVKKQAPQVQVATVLMKRGCHSQSFAGDPAIADVIVT